MEKRLCNLIFDCYSSPMSGLFSSKRPVRSLVDAASLILIFSLAFACGDESARLDVSIDVGTPPVDGGVREAVDGTTNAAEVRLETLIDLPSFALTFGVGNLEFEVPDDVLSLAVIVYGEPTGWYGIDAWRNGDDTFLVTADWPNIEGNERGCLTCENFTSQAGGVSTTIAPNRPSAVLAPGIHRISIVGWENGLSAESVSIRVVAKRGKNMPNTGTLDLNFYLTGAQGWTSETVQTDSYFASCIAHVNALYNRIGIEVGEINFFDVDTAFASISIAQGEMDLETLVSQSIQGETEGLNIFFVDEILTGDPDFPSIPGVSASVPNPPYLMGTVASGVAIALSDPLSVAPADRFLDPPAVGQTMAHELGHALGLFHTSEYDLVSHDMYADTPENDSEWLMHADGTGSRISPHQRDAVFSHPVIRHP